MYVFRIFAVTPTARNLNLYACANAKRHHVVCHNMFATYTIARSPATPFRRQRHRYAFPHVCTYIRSASLACRERVAESCPRHCTRNADKTVCVSFVDVVAQITHNSSKCQHVLNCA